MNTEQPTPRTDALHKALVKISEGLDWIAGKDYCDMKEHSRQLERELSAANERTAQAVRKCEGIAATDHWGALPTARRIRAAFPQYFQGKDNG